MSDETDLDDLADRIETLADAAADVREFGEANDIPAIEKNAERIEGVVAALRQNVPGGLDDE